ncbi:MAG: DNA translocase FtsK [Bacteroidetes bacterium]|nr:DNA translocase FtsK [Bacteroidota bacterium]
MFRSKPAKKAKNSIPKKANKQDDASSKNAEPSKIAQRFQRLKTKLEDPRIQAAAGTLLMAGALFLCLALVSGLFTGAQDYALVFEGLGNAMDASQREPFHNWLGGIGAYFAFWVGRQGFGVGALAWPIILAVIAWPLISRKKLESRWKLLRFAFFWMIFIPWVGGFLATLTGNWGNSGWDHWVGATGRFTTDLGLVYLGNLGSGLVIFTVIIAIAMFYFQPRLESLPRFSFESIKNWFVSEDRETSTWEEGMDDDDSYDDNDPPFDPDLEEYPLSEEEEENSDWNDASEAALNELLDDSEDEFDPEPIAESPTPASHPASSQAMVNSEEDDLALEVKIISDEAQLSEDEIDQKVQDFGEYDPTLDLSRFELPNLDLLVRHGDGKVQVSEEELGANKTRIIETLRNFSIEVSSISAEVGPTVTLYEIVPAPGIRISKIKNLEDDIALSLAALGIRIIAPIPGRGTIGIEVPNSNPDIVSMRSLIASDKFNNSKAALPIAMGKTISNETFVFDLAKMPHLLMAGATGQGKSVGLNAILVSLLYRKHPAQLKFVLVDPKKVELTLFNHIERHYLAKLPDSEEAIITDTSKVVATLNSLCIEMDQRYDLLKDAQCRNLAEYNAKFIRRRLNPEEGHRYLPYIVLVVDEFADLIMTAGKEVETPIARLAQLARAIGIHLIIATQRPSVNIITGTIKANFPARIAFRVTSKIDSRTILDAGGADQLIGRGDMLMSTGNDLIRIQCGFVDTPEVEAICEFIGSQQGYPDAFMLPEYTEEGGAGESGHISDEERDDMFEEAARVIVIHQQGSTSLLQRKMKIGYNRAGRIIDQLEDAGIIGPFEGSKARKVLVPDEMSLEQMLQKGDA